MPQAASGFEALAAELADPERVRVFYLATSPDLFGPICGHLAAAGLITMQARVVLEKPIGHDLASARAINDQVGAVLAEDQIFRIDHYLGKETVQNLMALRFANSLFEPLWNAAHVDHVQITVAESLGIEGRGAYYDTAGACATWSRTTCVQLLCLVAMEPPTRLEADAVRDEKLKVLRALRPIAPDEVSIRSVRGQYRAGAIDGDPAPGYLQEIGAEASMTETFVVLKAEIEGWRWAGVPFYLRTGKRLPQRASEIVIQFRAIPHSIFSLDAGSITAQPPDRPPAARRGHQAVPDGQGPGAGRHAPARGAAQSELRRDLPGAQPGRLRAAADGRRARQSDAVHASRRGRGRLGLDRADHRSLARTRRAAQALHRRQLGAVGRDRPDRARRSHLARGWGMIASAPIAAGPTF